jgi:predicted alpha/beta-fold hydrolase
MVLPAYRRERLDTPDGDFLDLDWVGDERKPAQATPTPPASGTSQWPFRAATDGRDETPLVILFHGLEVSSASHYARALMHAVVARGWHGVVVHFRGCSGEANRLPRAYHSGDSAEIAWVLDILGRRYATLLGVGVSLGGNAMLKYLGEHGKEARLQAAAAVSVPYDLAAANRMLSRGVGLLYSRHFLRSLIPGALQKAARFPEHIGFTRPDRIRAARTLRDFDEAVTAPLHGFSGADHYYTDSSCAQYLANISVPTLLVHALNDPFLPPGAIPLAAQLPGCVQIELSSSGGHVGFVSGAPPGRLDWLPQRLLAHLGQHSSNNRVA